MLDIGDGVGALVVHTPSELCGVEIEIARRGETNAFVHTEVRERVLPEGSVYAGVFVALDEGDYTLLDVDGHLAARRHDPLGPGHRGRALRRAGPTDRAHDGRASARRAPAPRLHPTDK